MNLDVQSVASGLLHDTLEDSYLIKEQLEQYFGTEVAELVDGVTKISRIKMSGSEDRQAENLRKMILAMSKDIRVILIKLADRYHNMQTLNFMPPEKQAEISRETLDIYAPLAHRLGIEWLRGELEDLTFKYLKPVGIQDHQRECGQEEEGAGRLYRGGQRTPQGETGTGQSKVRGVGEGKAALQHLP